MKARKLWYGLGSAMVLLFAVLWLFPIYIVVVNSFKSRAEMYLGVLAPPRAPILDYYIDAMRRMDFLLSLRNSLIVTVLSCLLIPFLASMCAWMMTRSGGRFSRFMYGLFVATMLIPFQTVMMPLMQEITWIRQVTGIPIRNTLGGLVFLYIGFGAPMAVFLYSGFVKTIPLALEEAALIDGSSQGGIFFKVVLPLLKPTTMTVIILDVIWIFNDYMLPALTLLSPGNRTIPLSTFSFFGNFKVEWNLAMAGLTLTIIPVIVFYLAAQKYIVEGVAAGAVKG